MYTNIKVHDTYNYNPQGVQIWELIIEPINYTHISLVEST